MANETCGSVFCALNYLSRTPDVLIPIRVERPLNLLPDVVLYPIFWYLRVDDQREVHAIFCTEHTPLALFRLMQATGCD